MGTVRMSNLLEQARSFDPSKVESRTTTWAPLGEGFASDAQRRAAFASGYKEKDKNKKEEVEDINELTAAEKKLINMMYDKKGNLTPLGKKVMDHGKKVAVDKFPRNVSATQGKRMESKEEVEVQESGHTDVASAQTNVKVAMSALTKMSGELSKLSPEDALPSWWTNKVAIAVDKLDGMADYLDTQVEEVELDELKVKDIVIAKTGPHKGVKHTIIHDFGDGTYNVRPNDLSAKQIRYKMGAAKAKGTDLTLTKEEVELDEGTWHIAKNMNALKKRMQKPIPKGDLMVKFVMKHIGDDELADDMFDAKTGTDMVPMIKSAMKRLNIKEEVELDEAKFSPKEIKMAIGIASDKRYAGGNMTGAVKAIEKMKKGLSDHPQVMAVLKRQNENLDEGKMKDIVTDVEDAMGKIKYKLSQKGGKFIIRVSKNDEKDAQKAMKMNPLYIAGKLRVIPESFLIASTVDRITRSEARDIDPADIDVRATDKDVDNASKNIILQLRKVINLRGAKPVEFASGKEKVHPNVAAAALTKHENMRRADDKEAFQRRIARSYKDLLNAVKGK